MKKTISFLLFLIMFVVGTLAGTGFSANASSLTSGYCGENVKYSFDSLTETLIISGSGECYNYGDYGDAGYSPFFSKSEIKCAIIKSGVSSIGSSMFEYCSGLESIILPTGLKSIGGRAFYSCKGLKEIELSNSVSSVGAFAFFNCVGMEKVNINSIEAWCNITFSNEESNPLYCAKKLYLNNELITSLTIPVGLTSVGKYSFTGCTEITDITVPNNVLSIEDFAFFNCSGLTNVYLGNSVTSIGGSSFQGCTSLTNIEIPNSVKSIGGFSFKGCTNLISIELPNSVASIGHYAFSGCNSMKKILLPNNISLIDDYTFSYCNSLESITIPKGVTGIREYAFSHCESLKSVDFEKNSKLNTIGKYAFNNCHSLISFVVPKGVASLGENSFSFCKSLQEFVFSENINTIPERCFYGSFNIELFIIPKTITKIEGYAFCECENLGGVAIPPTVTYIHQYAVDSCGKYRQEPVPNNPNAYYNIFIDGSFRICGEKGSLVEEYASTTRYPFEEHAYSTNRIDATCTEKGKIIKTCAYCGLKEITDIIPELGHVEVIDEAVAPTCTKTGLTEGKHCSRCDAILASQKNVAALGHSWNKGVITKKSTPTATGIKTYTCSECSATKNETIPKCAKYANPIKASGKTATVKFKNLKKKNQTIALKKAMTVSKAQGKVTYKKSSGNKKITVADNGKITVKKGLKKGTYKVKIKVAAAGNSTYKAATKTVTVTIKIK